MPQIIPIRDLKNTSEISKLCHESDEPIFVTKNGYGDMVFMSMETYERNMFMNHVYKQLEISEKEIAEGKTANALEALSELKSNYGL
jgi:PHD/YefM family antitoxin component YafN of YafNO toxin-antitoxin module